MLPRYERLLEPVARDASVLTMAMSEPRYDDATLRNESRMRYEGNPRCWKLPESCCAAWSAVNPALPAWISLGV